MILGRHITTLALLLGNAFTFGVSIDIPAESENRQLRFTPSFIAEVAQAKSVERIGLNPRADLFDDIIHITHSPANRRINVSLKSNARCPTPILQGRLSGRALGMIKWEKQHSAINFIYGHYEVPFDGPYFIEIIMIYCAYDQNDMDRCLVPGETHRITMKGAEIRVTRPSNMKGYWVSDEYVPLITRWQPQDCRGDAADEERCDKYADVTRFDRYNFVTYPKIYDRIKNLNTRRDTYGHWMKVYKPGKDWNTCLYDRDGNVHVAGVNMCDFCAVGASHTHRMTRFMVDLVGIKNAARTRKAFPETLDEGHFERFLARCKVVVVGFGQHDLGYQKTTPAVYEAKLRDMLTNFKNHPRVIGRSVHFNPLGDEKLMCPPKDNRSPPFVDDYNEIQKRVFEEFGREFLDTRWINAPMWDAATDWNHQHWSVEFAEAFYIADYLGFLDDVNVEKKNVEHNLLLK